jgi:hypothetical protein
MGLPFASKALAPLLWLLASESKDGSFNAAIEELAFRLHAASKEIEAGLKPLIDKGFFVDASTMLAPCLHIAIPETETETEGKAKRKRDKSDQSHATRLSPDWVPTEKNIAFCKAKRPDLNPIDLADRFRDYWISQAGEKGVKLDWDATWRNWVRGSEHVASKRYSGSDATMLSEWAKRR